MASPVPQRRKFAFDLRKPILKGTILKQGGLHRAFKQRFFILYPGFLVYYDDAQKWQYDLQRGETLGSRLGAIKLKGGSVEKSKHPPKGAKYAFVIHCPDKSNNRSEVTFNCQSNEERYQWITKIESAIPNGSDSPQLHSKKGGDRVTQPSKLAVKEETTAPPAPSSAERQETVDEAALLATANHTEDDTKETHIDDVLGPSEVEHNSEEEEVDHETMLLTDNPQPNTQKDKEVVSSASIKVRTPTNDENDSNNVTSTLPATADDEQTTTDGDAEDPMEVKEVVIETEEAARHRFRDSIIDRSLIAENDQDSSSSEGELPQGDDENSSDKSSPPPEEEEQRKVVSPSIVVTEGTLKRETEASRSSSSPERAATPDKRRPSGALAFIEKRGYLYKVGGNVKTWNLRYFILQPGIFRYYKEGPQGKPLGEVKLKNVKILMPQKGEKRFSSYQFVVHTESAWNKRRDWGMAASTEKEMKEWMEAFELASGTIITNTVNNGSSE